jgi:hypothetical protein
MFLFICTFRDPNRISPVIIFVPIVRHPYYTERRPYVFCQTKLLLGIIKFKGSTRLRARQFAP